MVRSLAITFRFFLFIGFSFSSRSVSSTQKLHFGIKTYGNEGITIYSTREANVGEQEESDTKSLATKNFLFGATEDGNEATILWQKSIYYGMSSTESVAISTMEFDRNTGFGGTLFATYQNLNGEHNFGYIKYDEVPSHATVIEMTDSNSTSLLENLNVKIGVSAYLLVDGTSGGYFFGVWDSLENGDSIWCIHPNYTMATYTLVKMPEIYSGIHELADIIIHSAGDTSFDSIALDMVSRPERGNWECSTIQYAQFELYTDRPDEMFTRRNETAIIFDKIHADPSSKVSISVNSGLSLFVFNANI